MKTIEAQAKETLTQIKLGATASQDQYKVIWGVLGGKWCLQWAGEELSNSEAINKIYAAMCIELGLPFVNGFVSWKETFFEVSAEISKQLTLKLPSIPVRELLESQGSRALHELAENLTNEFETLNKDRFWDGEWYDELQLFLDKKLYYYE